jgi:hypothetical protein
LNQPGWSTTNLRSSASDVQAHSHARPPYSIHTSLALQLQAFDRRLGQLVEK